MAGKAGHPFRGGLRHLWWRAKFEKSSAGEPFRSDVESVIQMRLVATDPEQGDFVEADHGETLIIRP